MRLPDIPQGRYELFADLVHRTGVSETVTRDLDLPAIRGGATKLTSALSPARFFHLPPNRVVELGSQIEI